MFLEPKEICFPVDAIKLGKGGMMWEYMFSPQKFDFREVYRLK